MKLKTMAIAAAVLLAAAVLGWVLTSRDGAPPPEGKVGQPVLDAAVFGKAVTLRFDSGTDKSTLKATEREWVVTDSYDFPVQREYLSLFVFKLTEVKFERLVTRDPAVYRDLGVQTVAENGGKAEPNRTGIEFQMFDDKGESIYHVVFGNRRGGEAGSQAAGAGGQYLRDVTDGAVYLLNGAPRTIVKATDWLQVVILEFDEKKDLKRFAIEQPGIGKRAFTRVGEPPAEVTFDTPVEWTLEPMPAGRTLSHRAIGEVAKGIGDLFMVDVAAPDLTPDQMGRKELNRIEVDLFDGRRFTATVGTKPNKDGQHFMTIEASLAPGASGDAVQKQVDEYNRVFKGRTFIIHGWEADRILPSREGVFEEK